METKKKGVDGITSVNSGLFDGLYLKELEERLETDPLMADGLLNLVSTNELELNTFCDKCHSQEYYTICVGGTY